jgi:hypothetical protein
MLNNVANIFILKILKAHKMNRHETKDFPGEAYSNGHATMLEGREENEQWRDLSSNRKYNNDFKDYETMLLNNLPGSNMRTNEPMHAVLESELEDETEPGKKLPLGWVTKQAVGGGAGSTVLIGRQNSTG